jgi:hypothetical protein
MLPGLFEDSGDCSASTCPRVIGWLDLVVLPPGSTQNPLSHCPAPGISPAPWLLRRRPKREMRDFLHPLTREAPVARRSAEKPVYSKFTPF